MNHHVVWHPGRPLEARCELTRDVEAVHWRLIPERDVQLRIRDEHGRRFALNPGFFGDDEVTRGAPAYLSGPLPDYPSTPAPEGSVWELEPEHEAAHAAPAPNCTCGIYAAELGEARRYLGAGDTVLGRVYLWGRVVPGSPEGGRAQYAYPKEFYVDYRRRDLS